MIELSPKGKSKATPSGTRETRRVRRAFARCGSSLAEGCDTAASPPHPPRLLLEAEAAVDQIVIFDYAGVAVFAATGALAASRKQLDFIGFLFLAGVTGIGGGTVRDVVLDVPVFWIANPAYLLVCAAVAVLVYCTAHRIESRWRLLLWLDAVGLAAYCVFGAWKGLAVTDSVVVAVVMGVFTATFGGILRDQLAHEPSVLLRPEIYVTAALAGSLVFTLADLAGMPLLGAAAPAFIVALAIRGGALWFGWSFPRYRSRPGRPPDDMS